MSTSSPRPSDARAASPASSPRPRPPDVEPDTHPAQATPQDAAGGSSTSVDVLAPAAAGVPDGRGGRSSLAAGDCRRWPHHRAAAALDAYLEAGRARGAEGGALPDHRPGGAAAFRGRGVTALDVLPHVPGERGGRWSTRSRSRGHASLKSTKLYGESRSAPAIWSWGRSPPSLAGGDRRSAPVDHTPRAVPRRAAMIRPLATSSGRRPRGHSRSWRLVDEPVDPAPGRTRHQAVTSSRATRMASVVTARIRMRPATSCRTSGAARDSGCPGVVPASGGTAIAAPPRQVAGGEARRLSPFGVIR